MVAVLRNPNPVAVVSATRSPRVSQTWNCPPILLCRAASNASRVRSWSARCARRDQEGLPEAIHGRSGQGHGGEGPQPDEE